MVITDLQIGPDPVTGDVGEIDDTDFPAFSSDCKFLGLEIHILDIQGDQLGDTQSGRIDALHDGKIPTSLDGIGSDRGEELLQLILIEELYSPILLTDEIDHDRIDSLVSLLLQIFEECPEGNHVGVHGLYIQAFPVK